jgi:hypothetical protein
LFELEEYDSQQASDAEPAGRDNEAAGKDARRI